MKRRPLYEVVLPVEYKDLAVKLTEFLSQQMLPKVFCGICRTEVPDRKEYCAACELSIRIRKQILPHVDTLNMNDLSKKE
jgi:hypothetical protein